MTREQFISGVSFKVKSNTDYKGAPTFRCEGSSGVVQESRHSKNEKVLFSNHHFNITKIGKVGFEGFCFILHNKKVNIKYKFEDLIEFVEGE